MSISLDGLDDGIKRLGAVLIEKYSKTSIDRALRIATSGTRTLVKKRVFSEDGAELLNGSSAGTYDPYYFKTRQILYKRNNLNINFVATDSLSRGFTFERKEYNLYVLGINEVGRKKPKAKPKKTQLPQKGKEPEATTPKEPVDITNAKKYEYLSKRFGYFLSLSDDEVKKFYTVFTAELAKTKK